MNKYLKIILFIFIIILSSVLFSPLISLILPEKLTNHIYYRLVYHVIVDRETSGCHNDEEKALGLFKYVVDHEYAQGIPYKCKPMESLIYAEAYCDFQARTLNALLGIVGIPSRYAMLLDKDGISPHTLNEVFLDRKWCVFDTLTNNIFRDSQGNMLSLEEISDHPELIYNDHRMLILKEYNKDEYNNFGVWFSRMFPMPALPRRSIPTMFQSHIFDYISDAYFKVFGYNFFNFYQDIYLKFKKNYSDQDDFRLFFMARNYHLSYRRDLAGKFYNALLKEYPQSKYIEDTIFFSGILYFEERNFSKSVEFLKVILDKYSQKWRNAAYYYLGQAYDFMGNKEESLKAYHNSDVFRLPMQVIEELNRHGLQKH